MKNDQYFRHDVTVSMNVKLANLIEQEGVKGYGAYWAILEYLRLQSNFCATYQILTCLHRRIRTTVAYLIHIVEDYNLFVVEGNTFYSPGMCKRMRHYRERVYGASTTRTSVNNSVNKRGNGLNIKEKKLPISRAKERR